MHKQINSIKTWFAEHKMRLAGLAIIVLTVVVLGSFVVAWRVDDTIMRTDPSSNADSSEPTLSFEPSPLTGIDVAPNLANRVVTAIIVENSPEARPQSGLDKAGVVYEAIAEGGITRFIAMFQEAQPQVIGPVRSVRPYFLDFAMQFDAPIAHAGGSTQALNQIQKLGLRDLDQFANGGSYWRDSARFSPHNLYTSFANLNALNNRLGFKSSDFEPWERKDDKPAATPKATDITVNISSFLYNPVYEYHAASNTYKRSLGGAPHKDRETGKQLSPKVVVVLQSNHSVIDSVGHLAIQTTGTNTAWIFQDGNVIKGTWQRNGRDGTLMLRNGEGNLIKLNKGQVWVSMLPNGNGVDY